MIFMLQFSSFLKFVFHLGSKRSSLIPALCHAAPAPPQRAQRGAKNEDVTMKNKEIQRKTKIWKKNEKIEITIEYTVEYNWIQLFKRQNMTERQRTVYERKWLQVTGVDLRQSPTHKVFLPLHFLLDSSIISQVTTWHLKLLFFCVDSWSSPSWHMIHVKTLAHWNPSLAALVCCNQNAWPLLRILRLNTPRETAQWLVVAQRSVLVTQDVDTVERCRHKKQHN